MIAEAKVWECDRLLSDLNPEQREAVVSLDKPLLVLSGAGTGKTKVLTTKIAYIVNGGFGFPYQILAVTFSNRAAGEMKTRLAELTGNVDGIWLGTFHSICARLLRFHAKSVGLDQDFTILDADDQLKIIKQILRESNLDGKMAAGILHTISRWKDKCYRCDDKSIDGASLDGKIYKKYQERIRSYDSVDFGDLIMYVIQLFAENDDLLQKHRNKFRFILVDEYQDTNMSQYFWLRMLSPTGMGLCCVGDDDQAIYSWRGAEIGNILRFEKDFPQSKIVRLERNYRSDGHILGAAASIIAHNKRRLGKTVWTEGNMGEKVFVQCAYNGFDESKLAADKIQFLHQRNVKYAAMAILVRAGFQTREFEERLLAYGLPYRVIGGLKFYDRREIKDIIAYMRLVHQPNDSLSFERIVNIPKRGIGASVMSRLHQYAAATGTSLYQSAKHIVATNDLRPSAKKSLADFVAMIDNFREITEPQPTKLAQRILDETGYITDLKKTVEGASRLENLRELLVALEDFDTLKTFVEHISLVTDSIRTNDGDVVSIMTLHSAKGLEFDAVFLVGWEDGIFPHNLSLQDENLEEERRLAYVGITRAKKYVFISYAMNRRVYNQWQSNLPSRFLKELPLEHIVSQNFCISNMI
jgi:DNA helicase-2/ATP-dependent DNA helicase PcrA